MPNFMTIFGYHIFFWSNENEPLEPVHIHISKKLGANATKYWIGPNGEIKQVNNNSKIPTNDLKKIEKILSVYTDDIINEWELFFGEKSKIHKSVSCSIEEEYDR